MADFAQRVAEQRIDEVQELFSGRTPLVVRPGHLSNRGGSGGHRAVLTRTVETAVVPRLLLAHGVVGAAPATVAPAARRGSDVADLATLALARDPARAAACVAAVLARGSTLEMLYLDLLAPAACYLGELWCEDRASFSDVTIALGRLQQMVIELGPAFCDGAARRGGGNVLLVPAPGEQHTFGLSMVADFFRRAGWTVQCLAPASRADLLGLVRQDRFDVVGFSMACGRQIEALADAIHAVRRQSKNPAIGVMVGGPAFVAEPDLALLVGADATATDARQAISQAQHLLDLLARPD